MLSTSNRLHRRFISLFSTHSITRCGTLHKLIKAIRFVGWWLLAHPFQSQQTFNIFTPFIVIAQFEAVFGCWLLVLYFFCVRVYVCNSFNFGQTERVEMKKCSKRIKCFLIWQSQRKELIFYHSLVPLFTRLITIWSCYTMHSLFFSPVHIFIRSVKWQQPNSFFFFFARNAKTPIVIYDLRVWTWDNVLCFIASILIQAIKFIQFLFVAVGFSSSSLRYRQLPYLCLPYRPCHSRIFLIHFSFLEQLNKCFYIDYMHLIYSLKCPLSFIWPFFIWFWPKQYQLIKN